jgi:hypothetical protein
MSSATVLDVVVSALDAEVGVYHWVRVGNPNLVVHSFQSLAPHTWY